MFSGTCGGRETSSYAPRLRVAFNGAHHAGVDEAAAEHVLKGVLDLGAAGLRIVVEEGLGGKDHAAQAEAALCRLLINEGLLNGVGLFGRAQPFQGDNFGLADGADRGDAGAGGAAIHQNGAGTALAQAAAEFGAAQPKLVAEHIEERSCGVDVHAVDASVDLDRDGAHVVLLVDSGFEHRVFAPSAAANPAGVFASAVCEFTAAKKFRRPSLK